MDETSEAVIVSVSSTRDHESDKDFPDALAEHLIKKRGIKAKCKYCSTLKKPISGNGDKRGHSVWSNLTRHLKVRKYKLHMVSHLYHSVL